MVSPPFCHLMLVNNLECLIAHRALLLSPPPLHLFASFKNDLVILSKDKSSRRQAAVAAGFPIGRVLQLPISCRRNPADKEIKDGIDILSCM